MGSGGNSVSGLEVKGSENIDCLAMVVKGGAGRQLSCWWRMARTCHHERRERKRKRKVRAMLKK